MNNRMPCSITDGEQYEDEGPAGPNATERENEDDGYDRVRQQEIDDRAQRIDLPDLRNQEQRDLGLELEWRLRTARQFVTARWNSVMAP